MIAKICAGITVVYELSPLDMIPNFIIFLNDNNDFEDIFEKKRP